MWTLFSVIHNWMPLEIFPREYNFAPPFSGTTEANPSRRKIKLVATDLEGLTVTCSTKVFDTAFICQHIN